MNNHKVFIGWVVGMVVTTSVTGMATIDEWEKPHREEKDGDG